MQTIGYFMGGSRPESHQTIIETISFAKNLKLDFAQFAITTPFPGTELYELYLYGEKDNVSWENFVYEGTGRKVTPDFETDMLSRADLQHLTRRAYKEFYLCPSYVWQRIERINSLGDITVNLNGLSVLLDSIKR